MNRRNFLRMMVGGIAATAAAEVIPLGRVWSFPSKVVIPLGRVWSFPSKIVIPEPNFQDVRIAQWADFLSISDAALDTILVSYKGMLLEKELSYRAAFSVNDIVRSAE